MQRKYDKTLGKNEALVQRIRILKSRFEQGGNVDDILSEFGDNEPASPSRDQRRQNEQSGVPALSLKRLDGADDSSNAGDLDLSKMAANFT